MSTLANKQNILLIALPWLWAGSLFGLSFVATPSKFLAPTLPLAQALDVGRATFGVFQWVEISFLIMLSLCLLTTTTAKNLAKEILIVSAILLTQYAYLLPVLDARAGLILAGKSLPESSFHQIYVGLEFVKLVLLTRIGTLLLNAPQLRSIHAS